MSFTHIYLFVCFVTIAPLTSESARLPGDCFRSYDQKVSAQQQRDVLPQCTIFMSNGSPVPRISCPEPGIVRFEGEYDAVHINCSASYPLDFKFNGTKPTEAIHVRFRRTVKEKSHGEIVSYHADVTIFSIRALHRFYSKSNPDWKQSISKQYQYSRTGGYTFLGFRENAFLKTDFYFFFEEELATRQFITNREGWKLRWDQYGKIIIPCRPTHFNSLVTLKQETNIPVLFTYSLTQGFISSHKATGVQGTFFCIMQDRGNGTTLKYDTAGLQVPYGYHVKPKDYNVDIQYNVTALPWGHYETKARCRPSCGTFDCGSNETAVLASIGVFNPSMDNLLNDFVLPKFQLRSYTVKIEHVQKDINHEIRFENGTLDYVAGIYCGNRDRSKKATFGRTLTGIVYPFKYGHDWSAVDRDHAEIRFYLNIWHNRPGQDLYENEDIVFECRLQTFVLAPPSIWFFEWENGTITEELVDYNWIDGVSRLSTKLSFGIKRVYCVGSIWHKTFWRNTSIPINVLPSTMPYFKHEGNPVKRFVSSSTLQYLKCTAYGGPKPTISWQHYGTNITSVTYTMDYSLLHFNEVNATIQGLYDCIACNVVGCKKKVYAVEVFSVDTPDAQCLTEETEVHGVSLLTYLATLLILIVIMIVIAITTRWRGQLANGLGKQELDAFFHGEKGCTWAIGGDLARCQPYNQAYEIPKKRFKIYRRDRLGTGEYGVVLRGSIDGKVTAVKMIKHSEDKQHLKFLMNELKIMIHLGRHENLVELVGAYTKELERSKLYVFLKFYKLGSLESYLRDNRCSFHVTKPAYVKFSNISSAENIFTIKDLFKWSKEIALGMEYLSRKKIVHADLAVRNVLLDDTRTARVTDYGLSRRIYDYNVNCIIKSDDDRGLPLRWMAMESFLDGSFSFKSDVWSYGVTLWEIFSLGNTPYGTETVSSTFVTKLERGHRLPKPNYASDRLYYEVMRKCWLSVPCQRPNFSEIVETIQNLPTDAETTERNRKDSSGSDHKHYSHYSDASEFEECD